jgi:uncharacterized protein
MKQKNKVYVTWKETMSMAEELVNRINKSKLKFDGIYGIPRGGLPLAVILSYRLNIPVLLYPTKDTLVVDDISDNGLTLQRMKNKKIATLYSTSWTVTNPDWFIKEKKSKEDWLVFPWEVDG